MWGAISFPHVPYSEFAAWDGTGDITQGRICWAEPDLGDNWPSASCARPIAGPLGLCEEHRKLICG